MRAMPRATATADDDGTAPARRRARERTGAARGVLLSLVVHGALVATLLGTAWGVVRRRSELPPVVLTADFTSPAPRAEMREPDARAAAAEDGRGDAGATDADEADADEVAADEADADEAKRLSDRLRALERSSAANPELEAIARRFGALDAARAHAEDAAPAAQDRVGASFAGLVSGNATKVAYVVDASGSMVGSFPAIVDEVERSLMRLEPTQRFTVICFRKDGALPLEGDPALRAASRAERDDAVRWLRTKVVPAGRSSPIEALAMALRSGADCVFLLSTTVTGPGSHELDRASMLALVDRLNPRDPAGGRRRATIQCIQFLEADPGGTLEAIAAEHFGEGGFRFIPRSATSLGAEASQGGAP